MKRVIVCTITVLVLLAANVHAKRSGPKKVEPVKNGDIEYRAPSWPMGYIEAWKGKKMLWKRQIYVVKYNLELEGDVQDVFITKMELKGNVLIITNESKSEYQLDLKTLKVKVLKGSLVETVENQDFRNRMDRDKAALEKLK